MRLLQVLFRIIWCVGYLGNGILFLYIEWTYLRPGFAQIFNPLLHLHVLGTLLATPLFWIFVVMALLGYYAAFAIKKQLAQKDKQFDIKAEIFGSQPLPITQENQFYQKDKQFDIKAETLVSQPLPIIQENQFSIPSSSPVQPSYKQVDVSETEYVKQQVKLLEWAIQSSQKVQFNYQKIDGEKSDRIVTPTGFKTVNQTLCLEGYCNLRQAKRAFDCKRMKNVKIVSPDETSYQPQSFSKSATATQSLRTNTPSQTSNQPKSPPPNEAHTWHTDALNQERSYIKCQLDEIERIAETKWKNVKVLNEIHHELEFRSR